MNDGGPAFPQHGWSSVPEVVKRMQDVQGLSMRDYFAAAATDADIEDWIPATVEDCYKLCGMLGIDSDGPNWRSRLRAWARYQHADAMLAERERKP